ncbi:MULTISPECIES: pyridoxal-phosphate-dependent aminotransferase family protein [Arthrobacter]|uniref:Tritium exchange subunit n=1 Tax=Arthrobacter sunyaminii TaxID=2816859 RepID=A0A975S690_9MICC|nr:MULTISPECIES: aminotransferase class V-fold PLP-dependent enzyme [Arthrobacter]MBO0898016.1 aminotransferase class V-fold PLP-dependent enzyme [Arthrobacter sunyaminii]MBO0909798.1 aminotransferase class V-fold PLP-dependent enzyme [Arthrobacter sunyaminii]QWQ36589.1 aminotransferase class V-fold PLP-dependent enzyme [Arthrobacter sunyaminii]
METSRPRATSGRHYLQIPGPTNCPDEVLRAIAAPTIDHRGPDFQELGRHILSAIGPVFGTTQPVIIYPASGTGAWEAALVNTLSPGDRVLCFETGHFSALWKKMAEELGLVVELVPGDWRHGIDPAVVEERLSADREHEIQAVCCVHNETSTGVTSRIAEVRAAMDAASHPALLLVDTISSLGAIDYRHDEWGVDVTISGSQKGLMLPPGLSFNAVSAKALRARETAGLPKSFWDWLPILAANENGFWPYTPSTNLLYGLKVALRMLDDEGLENVFARHQRHARATRAAVEAWGLEVLCQDPREYSGSLTAVLVPDGFNADDLRATILDRFDMSLGAGLSKLSGKVFRIGHLGAFEDLTLIGTLGGVQMGLNLSGIPIKQDGLEAAMAVLEQG